jgi:LPPG:FO 2-phospho-L-lactate transferase
MKVVVLAGGTGGTKLAHGFAMLDDVELTAIVNVADDAEMHGLHVSPDIDALVYTLAGLLDDERGWGVAGDTHTAHVMLARYRRPAWFTLGDADLATHVERTRRLRQGERLTDATGAMAAALGVGSRILPVTDDHHRTVVDSDDGPMEFQEYFVRRRQEPEVRGLRIDGQAAATPEVLAALGDAELVAIGPSNPLVSIGPILDVTGVREAVRAASAPVVAVSPIVGGRALKGPADRMLASLGHEVSALGVARIYGELVDTFVLDEADASLAPQIQALGLRPVVLPTVMGTLADRSALARALVGLV